MRHLIIILFLTAPAFGTMVGFDADDFADYENISSPIPELNLWRSTYRWKFDKIYPTIFAVPSTDPAKPLGDRVIGYNLAGYFEYWDEEPCLYITVNGLASSISITTANRPNWINKNVIVDCWDIDGNQVAHNFTNIGRKFTTDVGEYTISSIAIWTVGQMAIDEIEVNYIPEPATITLLGLGFIFLTRKRR